MNAKEEFLREISGKAKVLCAKIEYKNFNYFDNDGIDKGTYLKLGYSDKDFEEFLKLLDFEYDNGYGGQELDGFVWFEDGTWLERGEYDGAEWWEHKVIPEIPKECK